MASDMTLTAFLAFLLTGPGVAVVLSAIMEYVPFVRDWADSLSYNAKRLMVMVVCLTVPLLAAWLLVYLGQALNTAETWFRAAAAGWLGYVASQTAHLVVRREPHG